MNMYELINEVCTKFVKDVHKNSDMDAVYFILEEIGDREDLSESKYDFLCNKVYEKLNM